MKLLPKESYYIFFYSYRVQALEYDPVSTSDHLSNFALLSFVLSR